MESSHWNECLNYRIVISFSFIDKHKHVTLCSWKELSKCSNNDIIQMFFFLLSSWQEYFTFHLPANLPTISTGLLSLILFVCYQRFELHFRFKFTILMQNEIIFWFFLSCSMEYFDSITLSGFFHTTFYSVSAFFMRAQISIVDSKFSVHETVNRINSSLFKEKCTNSLRQFNQEHREWNTHTLRTYRQTTINRFIPSDECPFFILWT